MASITFFAARCSPLWMNGRKAAWYRANAEANRACAASKAGNIPLRAGGGCKGSRSCGMVWPKSSAIKALAQTLRVAHRLGKLTLTVPLAFR